MSQMIVVLYPTERQAERVMTTLQVTDQSAWAALKNVTLLSKDDVGRLHIHLQLCAAQPEGAWKSLMELLFMALSTESMSFAIPLHGYGIDELFLQRLSATFCRKSSAIFILTPQIAGNTLLPLLSKFGGIVLQASLSERMAPALSEDITEQGLFV